jgi:hypothetical protein
VIVTVTGRVFVVVNLVLVIADVEVEVEEAGAKLTVAVPVAGGMETETADTDDDHHSQGRAGQPGTSDHGSAEASHLGSPRSFYRNRRASRQRVGMKGRGWMFLWLVSVTTLVFRANYGWRIL